MTATKTITLTIVSAIAAFAIGLPAVAKMKGAEFAGDARFSLSAARLAALKVRPGTITDQELEKEKGGSGLRYSFDITSQGKPFEVGVDAKTGAILENVAEARNPD